MRILNLYFLPTNFQICILKQKFTFKLSCDRVQLVQMAAGIFQHYKGTMYNPLIIANRFYYKSLLFPFVELELFYKKQLGFAICIQVFPLPLVTVISS